MFSSIRSVSDKLCVIDGEHALYSGLELETTTFLCDGLLPVTLAK